MENEVIFEHHKTTFEEIKSCFLSFFHEEISKNVMIEGDGAVDEVIIKLDKILGERTAFLRSQLVLNLQSQVQDLCLKNRKLEKDFHEQIKKIQEANERISDLESVLKERVELKTEIKELYQKLHDSDLYNEKLETKYSDVMQALIRKDSIQKKLSQEVESKNFLLKKKDLEVKKVVQAKDLEISDTKKILEDSVVKLEISKRRIKKYQKNLEALQKKFVC